VSPQDPRELGDVAAQGREGVKESWIWSDRNLPSSLRSLPLSRIVQGIIRWMRDKSGLADH
jgi:hypothetical protein